MSYEEKLTSHIKRAELALNDLRPVQVQKFAERYYRGDWRTCSVPDLLAGLIQEVGELAQELRSPWRVEEIAAEAADVANYAAMIADMIKSRAKK